MKFQKSVSKYALFSLINFPFLLPPFYFIDINLMCPCHETDSNVIHNTFAASFASLYFLTSDNVVLIKSTVALDYCPYLLYLSQQQILYS